MSDVLYCPLCGRKMRLVEERKGKLPYEVVWECEEHGKMVWRELPYSWEMTNDADAVEEG